MKLVTRLCLAACAALLSLHVHAASESGEYYIQRMLSGGPASVRDVAKTLYNNGSREQEVLDVLAEVMLRDYRREDRTAADAVAWGAKALGASGNARYRPVLEEIINEAPNRKLRGHAEKALKDLPKQASDQPYKKGMVNLDKKRESGSKSQASQQGKASSASHSAAARSGGGKFSEIHQGMTTTEVIALLGAPTSETSHITGKQFRPFNFKGDDTVRIVYLYKGKGRIIFNNSSHYTHIYRVLEVIEDSNEPGYP
ncbi:MAG: HEAT repeat domain-containing protein [Gammaproteobacteria bacterium]|nr:MAG: HEAT repeat domain-containing protein [Gammaproteobacteria bacterium]